MRPDLDEIVLALVRRHGRRGLNEATVWTLVSAEMGGVAVVECTAAVGRLVAAGRLYRQQRRTRTMLHCGADRVEGGGEVVASLF